MRIVLDLQGMQTSSRERGIGRYTKDFSKACIRNKGSHEIILFLSNQFPETIMEIRAEFEPLLPQENIVVWNCPTLIQSSNFDPLNLIAQKTLSTFLESLNPDIVHSCSFFEPSIYCMMEEDFIASSFFKSVILYDLIPYFSPDVYINGGSWLIQRLNYLRHFNLILGISDSASKEGRDFGIHSKKIVNISSAADPFFQVLKIDEGQKKDIFLKYGLSRPFLMYISGPDVRKNFERLITAYGLLSFNLRKRHQLLLIVNFDDKQLSKHLKLVKNLGLSSDEVIFINKVTDDELRILYNLCKLFVFPSVYEGFGLPVLEAMQCGAPVICSNNTSLPEVVQNEKALFDPFSVDSIKNKMEEVLTNKTYRKELIAHQNTQKEKFSWDFTAKKAIAAFEKLIEKKKDQTKDRYVEDGPVAFVCAINPNIKELMYYTNLFHELSKFYEIDIITNTDNKDFQIYFDDNCVFRTPEWFLKNAKYFKHIIYFVSDRLECEFIITLLKQIPGVVVLHDFYLGLLKTNTPNTLLPIERELYDVYSYTALSRIKSLSNDEIINQFPLNKEVIENAKGVIVHSNTFYNWAQDLYGKGISENWAVIENDLYKTLKLSRLEARRKINLSMAELIICFSAPIDDICLLDFILDVCLNYCIQKNKKFKLVILNEINESFKQKITNQIIKEKFETIVFLEKNNQELYSYFIAASDLTLILQKKPQNQLAIGIDIYHSMFYGVPLVANEVGIINDFSLKTIYRIPENFSKQELLTALDKIFDVEYKREHLTQNLESSLTNNEFDFITEKYLKAFRRFSSINHNNVNAIIQDLMPLLHKTALNDFYLSELSKNIVANQVRQNSKKQLLVDITYLVRRDAKSGIQRVVRSILKEFILEALEGFKIEPVYIKEGESQFRYARDFSMKFFNSAIFDIEDEYIDTFSGDVLLLLDLHCELVEHENYLRTLSRKGVLIYTCVYDCLPVLKPQFFSEGLYDLFNSWLSLINQFNGIICISRSVADELWQKLEKEKPRRNGNLKLGYFHLGAEMDEIKLEVDLSLKNMEVIHQIKAQPTFLMVSTIEPRKGYTQALQAFELLWNQGEIINLIIVGKKGWNVDELIKKIETHPRLNKQLFWFNEVDDGFLEQMYINSTCLVFASEGEGFGLSLIEAAHYSLPLLIRDIPVFREIAGGNAAYFSGLEPEALAKAVEDWLELYEQGKHPQSKNIQYLSWAESAKQLQNVIFGNQWYKQYSHEE